MRRFKLMCFDPRLSDGVLGEVSYGTAAEGCAFSNGNAYVVSVSPDLPLGAFWFSIDEMLDFYTCLHTYIVEWID